MAGERFGLIGPNGAGKTTLFSIILGESEAESSKIELARGIKIGYLPQETAVLGEETVAEMATSIYPGFTEIYKILRAEPNPDAPERIHAVKRFVELDGYTLKAKA